MSINASDLEIKLTEPGSFPLLNSRFRLLEELENLEQKRQDRLRTLFPSTYDTSGVDDMMQVLQIADKLHDSYNNMLQISPIPEAEPCTVLKVVRCMPTKCVILKMPTEPAYLHLFCDLCFLMAVSQNTIPFQRGGPLSIMGVVLSLLQVVEKDFSNTPAVRKALTPFNIEIATIDFDDPAAALSCIYVENTYWKVRLLHHANLIVWPRAAKEQLILHITKTPSVNWPSIRSIEKVDLQIYISVIFAVLLKQANEKDFYGWLQNRIRDFADVFENNSCVFKPLHFPGVNFFSAVHWQIKYHSTLMSEVFQLFLKTAKGSDDNPWKKACTVLLDYAKWSGMTYFHLIEEYIVKRHPFILKLEVLAPDVKQLCKAYRMLYALGLPEEMWPYVKILKRSSECEFLNSKNYTVLTAIAQEIGKEISPSLANYRPNEKPTPAVEQLVRYVGSLIKTAGDSASAGPSHLDMRE